MSVETKELNNQPKESLSQQKEELKNLNIEVLKSQLIKEAPLYKKDIEDIKDPKKLNSLLQKIRLSRSILWENFDKLFLKWEEVAWYKVEGLKLKDLNRFLDELLKVEAKKDILKAATIILTLEELKELEKVIKTEDTNDDLEFLRAQILENVSSYDILSENVLFTTKIQRFLEKNCKWEKKECNIQSFLNKIDNQIFKFLQKVFPEDVSMDTLRNMATGFNIWFMLLFNDLDKNRKQLFLRFLEGFNDLVNTKSSTLDKLEGLINTWRYWYEWFKIFAYVYDFIRDIKYYAKKLKVEDWENYVNFNNPTRFAKFFERYILAKINGWSTDSIIKEMFSKVRQWSWLDFEFKKAQENRKFDSEVIGKLNQFSKILTEKDIRIIYNLTNDLEKVWNYKRKVEEKIDKYTDKFKNWWEKLASLICLWKSEECRNSIMSVFYKIYSLIVDILNALGLHIEKKWKFDVKERELKKFNQKFIDSFISNFIVYDTKLKVYRFNDAFKETIFVKYLWDLNNKYFSSIQINWSLSQETMKWLQDQWVDVDDTKSLKKILKNILSNKIDDFRVIPNIKDKVKKIIFIKDNKLQIDLTRLDLLLKEVYWYSNLVDDLYKLSEKYVNNKLEKDVDKNWIKEISEKLGVPEEVVYAILIQESGRPAQIGKLMKRFEPHKYEEFKRKWYNDDIAKKLATSYGSFQIMWFNYKRCWYSSIDAFVKEVMNPNYEIRRRAQIESFVNFIKSDSELWNAMKNKDWQTIAKKYNGPAYRINNYDIAIKEISKEYKAA